MTAINNELSFDGKIYISVSRASKRLGYTADYIGQLCRAGKIDAKMIGRTWYVEWESVKNHKKSKKHRIRRTAEEIRKALQLKASENLSVTPVQGLEIEKDKASEEAEYISPILTKIPEEVFVPAVETTPIVSPYTNSEITVSKNEPDCPPEEYLKKIDEALPISYTPSEKYFASEDLLPKLSKVLYTPATNKKVVSIYHPSHLLVGALAVFILVNVFFVGMHIISPNQSSQILGAISNFELPFQLNTNLAINNANKKQNIQNTSSIYSGIKDALSYVFGGIKEKINHFAISYMKSLGFATKEIQEETPGGPVRTGMVVVPDDKDHNKTVTSIKKTFSDEVSVVPDEDEQSGVIVPHFKEVDGDTYTYVLIPINSP